MKYLIAALWVAAYGYWCFVNVARKSRHPFDPEQMSDEWRKARL